MTQKELIRIAKRINSLLIKGRCIAWVGSGLSKSEDYPGWSDLVDRLCSVCGIEPPIEKSSDQFMIKSDECKKKNFDAYQKTLKDTYSKQPYITREAFPLLMRLPFKAYVTTNFDPLLSNAAVNLNKGTVFSYPQLNAGNLGDQVEQPIFHIHGHAQHLGQQSDDYLVLSRSEFDKAYTNPGIVKDFLKSLLTQHHILFIGCELKEAYIYEVFRRVHGIIAQINPSAQGQFNPWERQILLSRLNGEELSDEQKRQNDIQEREKEESFRSMKIEVIPYTPDDERKHEEIEKILRLVCVFQEVRTDPTFMFSHGEEILS